MKSAFNWFLLIGGVMLSTSFMKHNTINPFTADKNTYSVYIIKSEYELKVYDEEGEYSYVPDDVFIFPANTQHKISNNSEMEHEMIFVRVKI